MLWEKCWGEVSARAGVPPTKRRKFLQPTRSLSFRTQTSGVPRCLITTKTACFLGAVGESKVPGLSLQLKSKQVQTNEIKKSDSASAISERIKVKNTIIALFPHLDGVTSSRGNRGRSFSSCLLSADASPQIRSLRLKLHVHK